MLNIPLIELGRAGPTTTAVREVNRTYVGAVGSKLHARFTCGIFERLAAMKRELLSLAAG